MATDEWVNDRIQSLTSDTGWTPNATRALAKLRERNRIRTAAIRRWIWSTAVAASLGAVLVVTPASRACAEQPASCVQRMLGGPAAVATNPAPQPVASTPAATPAPAPVARQMIIPPTVTVEVDRTYRQTGSANAPIRIEIYLDYDCPHCATFVHDVLPALNAAYVQTGKVALRYRDFPLPTHRFALLAARYANAAGELGFYDVAMRQILDTRQAWDTTGDIETQLAAVLTPDTMKNLRERLNDPFAADSIAEDKTSGEADHLDRTPFAVIVYNGVRQPIAEAPLSFEALKNRIDAILEQK